MKRTLIIAIALASITAFAQTETTATTTAGPEAKPAPAAQASPTVSAQPAAPAAKKASAKKAAGKKKTVKPSAMRKQAPAVTETSVALASAAPVTETGSSSAASTSDTKTAATAAGTSSTTAAAAAAPTKKWGATVVSQASASNDIVRLPVDQVTVDTINYIGASYKVTSDTKVGVRQYFKYDVVPGEVAKGVLQWPAVTVGTKVNGIAGSDAIAPLFWYYVPTESAIKNVFGTEAGAISHNGILRMDAEIVWTLNPKWQLSYYFIPRQSLVNKQSYQDLAGKTKNIEAQTTLIQYGYAYYNLSDATQFYGFAGMDSRMTTADTRSIKDHALLGVGAVWTLLGGKVIINPEIGNEVALKDNGEYASAPRWLQSEDIGYTLTGVLSF